MIALFPKAKEKVYKRWASKQGRDSLDYELFNKSKIWEKAYYDAGGLLVAGTDPTYDGRIVAGYANMRLVELFVEMGFNISEAIKICTLNGAKYLDQEKDENTRRTELRKRTTMLFNNSKSKDKNEVCIEDFELLKVLGRGAFGKVILS